MKKSKYLVYLAAMSMLLFGCDKKVEHPDNVFVTFRDYDESILYHARVPYGSKAKYAGAEPVRKATAAKVYSFVGWDKNLDDALYENTIFNAEYAEENRAYLVTFYNYDDTEIWHTNVEYGDYARYSGRIPTKDSDDPHFEYEFAGWDKSLSDCKITEDTSFKATFKVNEFVFATFNNYDGSLIAKEKFKKGSEVVYRGDKPEKPYDGDDKIYKFTGWDVDTKTIERDTVYTAEFALMNLYTVTFENYDGKVLKTVKVVEGETAVYDGSTPHRPSTTSGDYIYSYSFSGWSSSLDNVFGDMVVTAQFTSSKKVTGETAIRQHLSNNGTGDYHNVWTSSYSKLGYSGSYYYAAYSNSSSGVSSTAIISFGYGDTVGIALFSIVQNGSTTYYASMSAYVSGHRFSSLKLISIKTCKYTTNDQLDAVAALSILSCKEAINAATDYLESNSLPYIW